MSRFPIRRTAILIVLALAATAPPPSVKPAVSDLTIVKVVRTEIGGAAGRMASFVAGMRGRDLERVEETLLSGNRMRVNSDREDRIIDLDAETITMIDHREKTARIVGFAEFRELMPQAMAAVDTLMDRVEAVNEEMPKVESEPTLVMDLAVEETGETREYFGRQARRFFVTMQGEIEEDDELAQPSEGGEQARGGTLVLFADLWMVDAMPGEQEMHDFSRRMAELLVGGDPSDFFADRQEAMPSPMSMVGHGKAIIRMQEAIGELKGEPIRSATYVVTVPREMEFDRDLAILGEKAQEPDGKKSKLGGLARGLLRRATGEREKAEAKMQVKQRTLLTMVEETTEFSEDAVPADAFDLPDGYRRIDGLFGR